MMFEKLSSFRSIWFAAEAARVYARTRVLFIWMNTMLTRVHNGAREKISFRLF